MTSELIERLEKAEGGSRDLDGEIMALTYRWEQRYIGGTCWDDYQGTCCPGARHLDWVWVDPEDDKWKTTALEGYEFTTSLDAALALAERLWPHVMWRVGHDPDDGSLKAELVTAQKPGDPPAVQSNASTPALALCIAILKARANLQEQG